MTISDPFACPAPGCNVFPYDTAQDLADHLLTDHAGPAPAVVPPAHPLVIAAVSAPATVRSFSPGGTRATTASPARPANTANPASEKQISYLRSLLERHPDVECNLDTIDKRSASALIDELRNRPRPTVSTPEPARVAVPEGFHVHDGTVYKVQISKTGNAYAKVLVLTSGKGEWDYAGAKPLRFLSGDTVATLEQAQAFGLDTGVCMCCGRTLTNPESIERGIGPICLDKHF